MTDTPDDTAALAEQWRSEAEDRKAIIGAWSDGARCTLERCAAQLAAALAAAGVADRGEPSVNEIAATSLANSRRWFPMVHGRSREATTTHLTFGVAGEAGEVVDVIKKVDVCGGLMDDCEMHKPGKHSRRALEDEMADLFTYLLALAAHEGIDLVAAWERKQAECEERWG